MIGLQVRALIRAALGCAALVWGGGLCCCERIGLRALERAGPVQGHRPQAGPPPVLPAAAPRPRHPSPPPPPHSPWPPSPFWPSSAASCPSRRAPPFPTPLPPHPCRPPAPGLQVLALHLLHGTLPARRRQPGAGAWGGRARSAACGGRAAAAPVLVRSPRPPGGCGTQSWGPEPPATRTSVRTHLSLAAAAFLPTLCAQAVSALCRDVDTSVVVLPMFLEITRLFGGAPVGWRAQRRRSTHALDALLPPAAGKCRSRHRLQPAGPRTPPTHRCPVLAAPPASRLLPAALAAADVDGGAGLHQVGARALDTHAGGWLGACLARGSRGRVSRHRTPATAQPPLAHRWPP